MHTACMKLPLTDSTVNFSTMNWIFLHRLSNNLINIICVSFLASYWYNYKHLNSLRYEIDTNYLLWTSPVPAFTVCQAESFKMPKKTDNSVNYFYKSLIRPRDKYCYGCEKLTGRDFSLLNISEIVTEAVAPCVKLFHQCLWNKIPFQCCDRFLQVRTKHGVCYSMNSDSKLQVSHFAKKAELEISVTLPIQIFLHDPKDVLFYSRKAPVIRKTNSLQLHYMVKHFIAHPSARDLSLDQRGCLFPDENGYKSYSESVCKIECERKRQQRLCGCFHHLLSAKSNRHCDFRGLECLDRFRFTDRNISEEVFLIDPKGCECLPACDQTRIKIVWSRLGVKKTEYSVRVVLTSPPKDRVLLKPKLEFVDALVGFACLTRLFTNFNLLSLYGLVFKKC